LDPGPFTRWLLQPEKPSSDKQDPVKEKSHSVETERPLTIACHMKIFNPVSGQAASDFSNYFLVESTVTLVVESLVTTVVSG
jgi:hypothetical protein